MASLIPPTLSECVGFLGWTGHFGTIVKSFCHVSGHIEHTSDSYEGIWVPCFNLLVLLGTLSEALLPRLATKSNLGAKRLTELVPSWPQFSILGGRFVTFEGLGCNVRLLLFSLSGFDGLPMILPDTLDICLNGFYKEAWNC